MLRTIAFVLALCSGFTLSAFSRFYALLFYLWFAVFRPQEWVWIDVEAYRFSLLIGLSLVLPAIATGVLPNLSHPLSVGMVAFLLTALIGQMNAINPAVGWGHLDLLARIVLVSLFIVTLVNTRERFLTVVAVIAGSLAFHAAKFGVSFILSGGGARFDQGVGGAFAGNNEFALAIARVVFLLVFVAQNVNVRWMRLGFLAAVPLASLGLVSTYSRGGFLALAVGLMMYLLLQRRRARSILLVTVAVLLVLTFAPVPEEYVQRLDTIRTYDQINERSALSRVHFWRVALVMAEDEPLGIGLRNYEHAYDQYDFLDGLYGSGKSVHNSHLQALVETGYLGFAVWLFMFAYACWTGLRIRNLSKHPGIPPDTQRFYFTAANALLASTAAFLAGGTFAAEVLSDLNWFVFGLVAALSRLASQELTALEREPAPVVPRVWAPPAIVVPSRVRATQRPAGRHS